MKRSLERRWSAADQLLFILALFFNPRYRSDLFTVEKFSGVSLLNMVASAYKRFFRTDTDPSLSDFEFRECFLQYFQNKGAWSDASMGMEGHICAAEYNKTHLDLLQVWGLMGVGESNVGRSGWIKLAIRVLSFIANSASNESIFSIFGITQTKLRNRLSPQKTHKLTVVRQHRHRMYKSAGLIINRAKRHFDLLSDSHASPPANVVYEDNLLDDIWPAAATSPSNMAALDALIAAALEDEGNSDDWEDDLTSEVELRALRNRPGPRYKKTKLVNLFRYPSPATPERDLPKHWHFNKSLLDVAEDVEAEAAEAQTGETDNHT